MMDLRTARTTKNLSLEKLANSIGLSIMALHKIESGATVPHPSTRERIESILGEIDWIATFSGSDRGHLVSYLRNFLNPDQQGYEERLRFVHHIIGLMRSELKNK